MNDTRSIALELDKESLTWLIGSLREDILTAASSEQMHSTLSPDASTPVASTPAASTPGTSLSPDELPLGDIHQPEVMDLRRSEREKGLC